MTDKITPYKPPPSYGGLKKILAKPQLTGLQARLANAKKAQADASGEADQRLNRLALMLDCSGSMSGERITSLKAAVEGFLQSLSLGPGGDCSIACECFPHDETTEAACCPLTTDYSRALLSAWALDTTGCTPMAAAMEKVITKYPVTRGILMSDGQPDSEQACYAVAEQYREAVVPIDTVHISSSPYGEEVLQKIAEMTGGLFIKFTDLDSFTKSFKYLSPALRPLMLSGQVGAAELGATELRSGGSGEAK